MAQGFLLLQWWLFCVPSKMCVQLNSDHCVFSVPVYFLQQKTTILIQQIIDLVYNTILHGMCIFILKKYK